MPTLLMSYVAVSYTLLQMSNNWSIFDSLTDFAFYIASYSLYSAKVLSIMKNSIDLVFRIADIAFFLSKIDLLVFFELPRFIFLE